MARSQNASGGKKSHKKPMQPKSMAAKLGTGVGARARTRDELKFIGAMCMKEMTLNRFLDLLKVILIRLLWWCIQHTAKEMGARYPTLWSPHTKCAPFGTLHVAQQHVKAEKRARA